MAMRRAVLFSCLLLCVSHATGLAESPGETTVSEIIAKLQLPLAVTQRPIWPAPPGKSVTITLLPQVDLTGQCLVSLGLPFGPGWVVDDARIRVTDAHGHELPAYTRPLARWWSEGKGDSLRSVLVQFEHEFAGRAPCSVTVTWDQPRTKRRNREVAVADTQIELRHEPPARPERYLAFGYRVPRVLSLLPADWLCASLLAWQQVPAARNTVAPWFEQHLAASFPGSLPHLSARDYSAHLFDRPATYLKLYVRSGEAQHLVAGLQAVDFYLQHLGEDGFFNLKPEHDVKYVFTESFALAYLLTGEPRLLAGVERALKAWETHTRIEYRGEGFWTERHHGFGMLAYLHAYEVTGNRAHLEKATRYFAAAWSLQTRPLHGGGPDGGWLHTSQSHSERGDTWVTSPWMSAFLVDAIWKYWMLTGDARAPASLAMYARFTLRHSLSPDGKTLVYMASPPGRGEPRPEPGGAHNMEGCYLLALGHYLTQGREPGFLPALAHLWPAMLSQDPNSTARMFTWRFRETSMLVWFLQHAPAPGGQ